MLTGLFPPDTEVPKRMYVVGFENTTFILDCDENSGTLKRVRKIISQEMDSVEIFWDCLSMMS